MSTCASCKKWFTTNQITYDNGETVIRWEAPLGQGKCQILNVLTTSDFGCLKYKTGGPLIKSKHKSGAPWQHKVLGPCPGCKKPDCGYPNCENPKCPGLDKCEGTGLDGHNGRCVGFGKVYYYDDGYIGEMRTQKHPKERELVPPTPPTCQRCTKPVDLAWNICPNCGQKLKEAGDTVVIGDKLSILGSSGGF